MPVYLYAYMKRIYTPRISVASMRVTGSRAKNLSSELLVDRVQPGEERHAADCTPCPVPPTEHGYVPYRLDISSHKFHPSIQCVLHPAKYPRSHVRRAVYRVIFLSPRSLRSRSPTTPRSATHPGDMFPHATSTRNFNRKTGLRDLPFRRFGLSRG